MITIVLEDSKELKFCFKNPDKELALYQLWMWFSTVNILDKKFRITIEDKKVELSVGQIKDMKFERK